MVEELKKRILTEMAARLDCFQKTDGGHQVVELKALQHLAVAYAALNHKTITEEDDSPFTVNGAL